MPEGHAIHRAARLHNRLLAGSRLQASSPQGRFAAGAARIDGDRLHTVDATGKHLFYRWANGSILHVHLGLYGKFQIHHWPPPRPSPNTRLALSGNGTTLYLAGPAACDLIDPAQEEAILGRLGPDPLGRGESAAFAANLSRRRIPVGAALLDQKVIAGIGNVYRSELLFLAGIDPARPAERIEPAEAARIWDLAVDHLRRGARSGRIVTVDPEEAGARRRADLSDGERLYVYKRNGDACRRCGAPIVTWESAGRSIWACPDCQAR